MRRKIQEEEEEAPRVVRPREIYRDEVRRLLQDGVQLVEVLPAKEYEEDHLPGAINLPLRRLETDARQILDPARPVIVYCWDSA
ncbi:MAG: rhodanese-like domain-containing protein [Actinomycetota bacterium]